jgi:hypothetical protein
MRELSEADVHHQAEAFLAWSERAGVGASGFTFWTRGKDFGREDLDAIRRAVHVERVKRAIARSGQRPA